MHPDDYRIYRNEIKSIYLKAGDNELVEVVKGVERETGKMENFANYLPYLRDIIRDVVKSNCTRIYGASTKGNVLLQYCGIDKDMVSYAEDVNEEKWGKVTATGIPIVSPQKSDSAYLVLPWHFRDNILERAKKGDRYIFPLPKVEVVDVAK